MVYSFIAQNILYGYLNEWILVQDHLIYFKTLSVVVLESINKYFNFRNKNDFSTVNNMFLKENVYIKTRYFRKEWHKDLIELKMLIDPYVANIKVSI